MDTEIVCPRCLAEWPKYEEYVAGIKLENADIGTQITAEYYYQMGLLPEHVVVEEDGRVMFGVDYDDSAYMTAGELEAIAAQMRTIDPERYREESVSSEARIAALRERIREPKPYQRWLAGER